MPKLPDNHVLADRVMLLLRTTYQDWKRTDKPFDHAFMSLMDKYDVAGGERYPLKQAVGKILSARRRVQRKKCTATPPSGVPRTDFTVEHVDLVRVILKYTKTGDEITYTRDTNGMAVWISCRGNPTRDAQEAGARFADLIFLESPKKKNRKELHTA